jgi:signal peptidase I
LLGDDSWSVLCRFAEDSSKAKRDNSAPQFASLIYPHRILSSKIGTAMADVPNAPQLTIQPAVEKPKSSKSAGLFSAWMRDLVISLAISAFIIVFLYQPVKVEGTSMMPSLDDQERIFINKFVYRIEPIQRGDIVVFRYPRDPAKSFIKRVIGVAGDHVRIVDGHVFLNGKMLVEDYVPRAYQDERSYPEIVVRPEEYFVLGDHRSLSNDSRDFGPVDASYIYGKAVFGYWPVEKVGRLR